MCGIVGYSHRSGEPDSGKLYRLLEESSIRGLHAFGLAIQAEDGLHIKKSARLFNLETFTIATVHAPVWIFHNRYSTSGDYQIPENNQPIFKENVAVVLNGVISMKTKEEMEAEYKMRLETYNDTEIFLNWWMQSDIPALENRLRETQASVAALVLDKGNLFACRNLKRPLRYIQTETGIILASTADIFRRAGYTEQIKNIPPYKIVEVGSLWTGD